MKVKLLPYMAFLALTRAAHIFLIHTALLSSYSRFCKRTITLMKGWYWLNGVLHSNPHSSIMHDKVYYWEVHHQTTRLVFSIPPFVVYSTLYC